MIGLLQALLFGLAMNTHASSASFDKLFVSTIAAKSGSALAVTSPVILSQSSISFQGAAGTITSGSSITASSFFGDGSQLSGIGTQLLTATQTFSGANNFTSSFTVKTNGLAIVLSTSQSVGNLVISTTGISFYPQLHNSSFTYIPAYSTTQQSFGPCVSTVTITTSGGRVEVTTVATISLNVTGGIVCFGGPSFLQDGGFPANLSASKSVALMEAGNQEITIAYKYLLGAPASGSHSYCVTFALSTLGSFDCSTTTLNVASDASNIFYVEEIK